MVRRKWRNLQWASMRRVVVVRKWRSPCFFSSSSVWTTKVLRETDLRRVVREAKENIICSKRLETNNNIDKLRSAELFLWTETEKAWTLTKWGTIRTTSGRKCRPSSHKWHLKLLVMQRSRRRKVKTIGKRVLRVNYHRNRHKWHPVRTLLWSRLTCQP